MGCYDGKASAAFFLREFFKGREEKGVITLSFYFFFCQKMGWKELIMTREKGFLVLYMGRKKFYHE